MGKIKTKSLKSSMTATFLITICVIAVLSAITILASNHLQQEILKKRYLMINSPNFQIDEGTGNYVLDKCGMKNLRFVVNDILTFLPCFLMELYSAQRVELCETDRLSFFSKHTSATPGMPLKSQATMPDSQ